MGLSGSNLSLRSQSHWCTRMPGIGRLDGIHGECTNGIDTELVDRYCFYPGSHTCAPLTGTFEMLTSHTSYEGNFSNFPERWHTICLHSDTESVFFGL